MRIDVNKLNTVLHHIKTGVPVIVVDDYDRENEGDIVIAASLASYGNINFTAKNARGIMCLASSGEILDRLEVPMMVENSTDPLQTPFTVSVDASRGITTGVSVADRLKTIAVMVDPHSTPDDLIRPGHLFPLRARDGLLNDRKGHTEGSVTLMRLAELPEVAIICEIMNDDGTMARMHDLELFAQEHGLAIISIREIEEFAREAGIL